MKTELIRSFSSSSLSNLSRSPSLSSFNFGANNLSISQTGLVSKEENSKSISCSPIPKDEPVGCFADFKRRTFRKKILHRKLPIFAWLSQYTIAKLISDIIAGLTVGLTILPQGLAYATVAELPPQYGLYSGFVGCFVYIIFGGTKDITIGPTAITAIITLSYTVGKPPEYAVLLCFITGLVTLGMGLLQLGFIVNFISTPVISGFTSAAAITICSTQIKPLLGLNFPATGFLDTLTGTVEHITELKIEDTLLSLICILLLLFLMKIQPALKCITKHAPRLDKFLWLMSTARSAIVVVTCTIVFTIIGHPSPVAIVGDIVPGLPEFKLPPFEFTTENNSSGINEIEEHSLSKLIKSDSSALIVLPLLAIMEHITIAKAFAGTTRVDATQEMLAIGFSNLLGSFFSSIPVTGSFSRTVVNHASGAESPLGGLVTGVLVILALAFLTPYFMFIPKAGLAAVIVCAVIFMVDLDIIYPMWRSKKMDLIPWGVTFFVSLFVGLEFGILIGFIISVVFLLYYAARPGIRVNRGETRIGTEFILIELDRSLVFPSVEYIRYVVMKSGSTWGKNTIPLVIDCQHIQFVDFTAGQGMRDLIMLFKERKQELILWRVKPSIIRILSGIMQSGGIEFKFCMTEYELEDLIEASYENIPNEKNDIKITFTLADEENDRDRDSVSTVL